MTSDVRAPTSLAKPQPRPLVSVRDLCQRLGVPWARLERAARSAPKSYRSFEQRRVGSEKWRRIDTPIGMLKTLQRRLLRTVLDTGPLPGRMFGGVAGGSPLKHAWCHEGQPQVVTMDLTACFPKTKHTQVFEMYRSQFGCSPQIARVLTQLTTIHGGVPQGAPTSTSIVNHCLVPLFSELDALAGRFDLQFSMFIDDMAFSGKSANRVIEPAYRVVARHGYAASHSKLRLLGSGAPQPVTGTLANRRGILGAHRRRAICAEIRSLGRLQTVPQWAASSLAGKIAYARMHSPAQGDALAALARKLLPSDFDATDRPPEYECRKARRRRVYRSPARRSSAR